ncbi:MAG: RNA polymerase sigma factor [Thermomicrobiales bacterium]
MSLEPISEPPHEAHTCEAFEKLYAMYFDPIYWYCRGRLGDAQAAEDATSSVFAQALAAGPRYDDPLLRSWLFCIAHNVVVNAIRPSRTTHFAAELEVVFDLADGAALPEEAAIAEEERVVLHAALRRLPDDQRRVVELRMVGMTGPEIATLLGRTHPAVKMLQLRAFVRLRALLTASSCDEEGPENG